MKVLQVGSALHDWGGIERYLLYLSDGLRERGHEVDVTCPPSTELARRIPSALPISTRRKHDRRALSAYLRLFRSKRYDVVHVHFNPDFLVAGIAARLTRQPCTILTRHVALPWSKGKVKLYGSLFDHIIPVSNAVQRLLAESGIPTDRMTVAKAGCPPLSPSPGQAEVASELKGSSDAFAIGSFGRMAREKGLDLILEAAPSLPTVRFHLFGSGPLLEDLRGKGSRVGVSVHGFRTDVADCMSAMDALIIPSRWEEAFPYAALEAMSLGKPLIVSRVGGLLEIVQEGVTGLSFEKESPEDLARAAATLAGDPDLAKKMGESAREIHRSEYTVAKMAERIERVYEAVTASTRR